MDSYCFIYNPAANPATSLQQFEKLKELTSEWKKTRFLTSRQKGDIETLASRAANEFDAVIACGGDGTAREVAAGLMNSNTAMGVIPMGSGNDFSKSLNMPGTLAEAAEVIRNGHTRRMDMGRCNDVCFVNSFGIGFDGLANYFALRSKLKGNLKYIWGALKANVIQDPMDTTIIVEGQTSYFGPLIMITLANGRVEGGSFIVAPGASIYDGQLEVVTVRPVSKWILPFLLPLFVAGEQDRIGHVNTFRATKLRIQLDRPAFVHADGEIMGRKETEFNVELLSSILKVIGNFGTNR